MPGEVIDRPNPQPLPSRVPDEVLNLAVKLEKTKLAEEEYMSLQEFRRAANYIAAGGLPATMRSSIPDLYSHDLPQGQCPPRARPDPRRHQAPTPR